MKRFQYTNSETVAYFVRLADQTDQRLRVVVNPHFPEELLEVRLEELRQLGPEVWTGVHFYEADEADPIPEEDLPCFCQKPVARYEGTSDTADCVECGGKIYR